MTPSVRGLLTLAALTALVIGCTHGLATSQPTASPSLAAGVASELITPGVLGVCSDLRLPPQDILLDGQPMGSDIDLARELAGRLGLSLKVENTPRATIGQSLASGKCDAALSALRTTSPAVAGMLLIPYLQVRQPILAARSRIGTITGQQDLCGRTIEVMAGSEEEATLAGTESHAGHGLSAACTQAGKQAIVVDARTSEVDAAQSVIHGGADGFMVDSALAGWELATYPADLVRVDGVNSSVADENIAVLASKEGLRGSLSQALAAMRADGTHARILAKWSIAEPPAQATIDEANATTLARDFFDGAHGTGATVANVQIMSIALGNDSAGHSVWKVNISGDVLEAGRSSPSYTSYMWLYVDATSGVVTIFSQG